MNLGRPVADLDDFLEPVPDPPVRPLTTQVPEPVRRRPRLVWWLVTLVALPLASAGVVYWAMSERPVPTTPAKTQVATPTPPAGVSGFAEMYLAAYLTGATDAIDGFLPAAPSLETMSPTARYVTRTAALEVTTVADRYWSVMVAADVLAYADGAYQAAGLQYFQIGVVDDGGRLVAVSLPARVAAPAPRVEAPRFLEAATGTPTGEQVALAGDFFEALLTGRRPLDRYLRPDGGIAGIAPPPYQGISLTALALYDDGTALATVAARDAHGVIDSLQYVLRFTDAGPRPAVAELLAGPPVIGHDGSSQP